MQRSESSRKPLWKSFLSSKSKSPSTSNLSDNLKPITSYAVSSTSSTRSSLTSTAKSNRRSSLMILSDIKAKPSLDTRRISSINVKDLDLGDLKTTDSKELEFYANLFGDRTSTIEEQIEEELESDVEQEEPHQQDHTITTEKQQEQESDPLSSVLADYKLFTKRQSFFSPTESNFSHSSNDIDIKLRGHSNTSSLPSIPSFTSTKTLESSMSVLNVSNSLWVGSNIFDSDEMLTDAQKKHQIVDHDGFANFDTEDLFNDYDVRINLNSNHTYTASHRTSLIFGS